MEITNYCAYLSARVKVDVRARSRGKASVTLFRQRQEKSPPNQSQSSNDSHYHCQRKRPLDRGSVNSVSLSRERRREPGIRRGSRSGSEERLSRYHHQSRTREKSYDRKVFSSRGQAEQTSNTLAYLKGGTSRGTGSRKSATKGKKDSKPSGNRRRGRGSFDSNSNPSGRIRCSRHRSPLSNPSSDASGSSYHGRRRSRGQSWAGMQATGVRRADGTRPPRPKMIMLRTFNGVNEAWDTYLTRFESTCELNMWTEKQAAVYLRDALEGEAAECVSSKLGEKQMTLKKTSSIWS